MIDLISLFTAIVADEDLEFSIVSRKSRTSVFSGKRSSCGGIYFLIMTGSKILVAELFFYLLICFDAKSDFQFRGNDLALIGSNSMAHKFNILSYVICNKNDEKLFVAALSVVL